MRLEASQLTDVVPYRGTDRGCNGHQLHNRVNLADECGRKLGSRISCVKVFCERNWGRKTLVAYHKPGEDEEDVAGHDDACEPKREHVGVGEGDDEAAH